jgi:hypothetical protein
MKACPSLMKPASGTHTQSCDDTIVVSWPMQVGWEQDLEVICAGEVALRGPQAQQGYKLVGYWGDEDHVCVELMREAGWVPGHTLVQVRNRHGRSINQHFFTHGAHQICLTSSKTPSSYGYFWQTHKAWHVADKCIELPVSIAPGRVIGDLCVYYAHHSFVAYLDAQHRWKTMAVPGEMFRAAKQLKMMVHQGDVALICLKPNGHVITLFNKRLRHYCVPGVEDVGLSKGWFHVNAHASSRHLPWNLEPPYGEQTFDAWWEIKGDDSLSRSSWRMDWSDQVHVWFNRRKLVAHTDIDLLRGRSECVLWTDQDVRGAIEQVELVGGDHAIINDRLLVNLAFPSIEELSAP